ncbi:membrane dipeptidase [Dysgonomonas sp. 25]|uniref:membrane dipeptidase n=1 Tax=Dysgonomonas sp. 25 TaxID=2302933 RepID=UPI0013D26468|nr:membrane dipeptidase [Dysgonomonas sp. 25]NDV67385.1 fused gamma-glutamyl-gamma-aminobutyrate hydrolase/peptidase [Dysgonomonas sp. 25]
MLDKIIDFKTATSGSMPLSRRSQNPIIGLSVNIDEQTSRLHEAYIQAVLEAGGIPILIPATDDIDALREIADRIDGLLLTGGSDIDARYFGEDNLEGLTDVNHERDTYDFLLLKVASDRQLPIFGICRGMQVMNVAFGGGMWQDIPSQYPGEPLAHSILTDKEKPVHTARIESGSVLSEIFGKEEISVNSRHHQALKQIAPGFKVTATAPDGIVEAIEAFPQRRILGVQWHPENMASEGGDEGMKRFFRRLVDEAILFRQAKEIHRDNLTVDSHCDTPMLFAEHTIDIGRREPLACVDLVKMYEGRLDSVFVVAYLPQSYPSDKATAQAKNLLTAMQKQIEKNHLFVGQARTFAEADKLKKEGRKAIFLGIENGHALEGNLDNLDLFRKMGVVYLTLCHNGANDICDSAIGEPLHAGLSQFGEKVVERMNAIGMVIDLSHASESTFYDVIGNSSVPVVASHSSARALCDHPRNLTDDQIRAIASAGGVVQVCLYSDFLVKEGKATLMDAVDHIEHIIRIGGIEAVGIGSDFDGGGGIEGCEGANELINITVELLRRGYTEEQIAAIWGGNLRRAVTAVQNINR